MLVLWGVAFPVWGATILPPGIRWRQIRTAHLTIDYPEGLDTVAERAADWAEWAYERLAQDFRYRPARIRIILTDHTDMANALATIFPTRLIIVYLPTPNSRETIGDFDIWLKTVLVHELAHIFHLDDAHGIYRGLRTLFGALPIFYPNILAPDWYAEGLATFEETRWTQGGRACSMETRMLETTARRMATFPTPEQAWTARAEWPAGATPYHFGGRFLLWMAMRYPETFWPALRKKHRHMLPFFLNRSERRLLGTTLHRAWQQWRMSETRTGDTVQTHDTGARIVPEIVYRTGFAVIDLRVFNGRICWIHRDTHRFPGVYCMYSEKSAPERVAEIVPSGQLTVTPEGYLITSGWEFRRTFWLRSDLMFIDPDRRRTRWLTRGQRLQDPDVDERGRLVAVRIRSDGSALVIRQRYDDPSGPIEVTENAVRWSQPRWRPGTCSTTAAAHSGDACGAFVVVAHYPDGRWGLEYRNVRGQLLDRWLVDGHRKTDLAWTPDGQWLLFIADYRGQPELYAWHPATHRLSRWPIAADGIRTPWWTPTALYFTVHTPEGFHIARIPITATWTHSLIPFTPPRAASPTTGDCPIRHPDGRTRTPPDTHIRMQRPRSVRPILRPSAWWPTVAFENGHVNPGLAVIGVDPMGYSAYFATLAYRTPQRVWTFALTYNFDRWYPTVQIRARREATALDSSSTLIEHTWGLRIRIPWRTTRWRFAFSIGGEYRPFWVIRNGRRRTPVVHTWAIPLEWTYTRALRFPYSISPEDGWTAIGKLRFGLGDRRYRTVGLDGRFYLAGFGEHDVWTVRIAYMRSDGAQPEVLTLGDDPDADLFPVRGIRPLRAAVWGWIWNLEYRVPILEIQRSLWDVPVFLERMSGAVFYDGGVYRPYPFPGTPAQSTIAVHTVGAELRLHVTIGGLRWTLRAGIAWPIRPRARSVRTVWGIQLPF